MPGPVCSHNDWDPLEEVIVGTARHAADMAFEPSLAAYFPLDDPGRSFRGRPFPAEEVEAAEAQLDGLADLLAGRGITVRRPRPVDHRLPYATPDFAAPMGHCAACPRDLLLVVGDEIIEAPMAQRGRFFEYRAYRDLAIEYFRRGARWTTAPKPRMADDLYVAPYTTVGEPFDLAGHPGLTELEPCFDAASFVRCGRDIFWQPDLVSNRLGFEWLRRHLGDGYRLHVAEFFDPAPQHVDTTFVPVRPGIVLANPERPCKDGTVALFRANGWEVIQGPPSVRTGPPTARDVSNWISLNFLSLDERTVVVESAEEPLMELLAGLGCTVVPCPFDRVFRFGGSFHCCTTDIRRRGSLQSYFPQLDR